MGMKERVESVAFFIAVFGPLGIGLLVPARYLAVLLSAAWPVMIGVIMAITYGLPKDSFVTRLMNIAVFTAIGAVYGLIVFSVKMRWKARQNNITQ